MVKVANSDEKASNKMNYPKEKIQIFPSKSAHYNQIKSSNQVNKLTKTIMSPLTTMPVKKMIMMPSKGNGVLPNQSNIASNNSNEKSKGFLDAPQAHSVQSSSLIEVKTCVDGAKVNENPLNERSKSINENLSPNSGKMLLSYLHPYICCSLCSGYLIKATTIVECLHTFCHSCLMKHLSTQKQCPQCGMYIMKSKTNIKYDATIQSIVYKLVPGLYKKELLRRRAFYKERPEVARCVTGEERGDDTEHLIISPLDLVSISLDYAEKNNLDIKTKYLNCPAVFKIEHLKKFISNKFNINNKKFNVEISYKHKAIVLPEHYTLIDVAYIYTWKKEAPMAFYYRIIKNCIAKDELPEISLRRSPPSPMIKDTKIKNDYKIGNYSETSQNTRQIEPIKIKTSVGSKNMSVIQSRPMNTDRPNDLLSSKKDKHDAERESTTNQKSSPNRKDEYDFEDDLEQQKLGFLNTLQLTARKTLGAVGKNQTFDSTANTPSPSISAPKRKNEDPKSMELIKKSKILERKSFQRDSNFMFTMKSTGNKINFDMSLKPLGFKPSLEKIKKDIMMVKNAMDAKSLNNKTDLTSAPEKPSMEGIIKPKKLPLLLPKHDGQNQSNLNDKKQHLFASPTAFHIKKSSDESNFKSSKEISVTKLEENPHLQVYGPKTPTVSQERVPAVDKISGGFVRPLPPKSRNTFNSPTQQHNKPITIMRSSSPSTKFNSPLNLHACRTPFYVPSSPNYTPNFDAKPQFKYANPNAYASFMQTVFTSDQTEKLSTQKGGCRDSKLMEIHNAAKCLQNIQSSKKISQQNSKPKEGESSQSPTILTNIHFPSSLSVTLTNEQEETKKEHMRTNKQTVVNNNIEIIKIRDDEKSGSLVKSPSSRNLDITSTNVSNEQKEKQFAVVLPSPTNSIAKRDNHIAGEISTSNQVNSKDSQESFQKAFLDSINKSHCRDLMSKNSKKRSLSPVGNTNMNVNKLIASCGDFKSKLPPPLLDKITQPSAKLATSVDKQQSKDKTSDISKTAQSANSRQDSSMLANAAAMQHLMLSYAYPNLAEIQKTLMLETFRQNLALHHLQQHQKNQQQITSNNNNASPSSTQQKTKHSEKKE